MGDCQKHEKNRQREIKQNINLVVMPRYNNGFVRGSILGQSRSGHYKLFNCPVMLLRMLDARNHKNCFPWVSVSETSVLTQNN